jgi:hypothetical protein
MFGRARTLVMMAACVLATPVAAQAPAPPTSPFDGKYVCTATIAASKAAEFCTTLTSADMTITGGQVVIHEITFDRHMRTLKGSVNAAGEISTSLYRTGGGPGERVTVDSWSGIIHDKVFTGHHLLGHVCAWNVQMTPVPPPTMPFDGDYIGVSRESSCLANGVPVTLIIRNGVAIGGSWQGNVSPQGVVVMGNRLAPRVDGQIDSQGIIRAQGSSSDGGCAVTFVWRKQAG